MYYTRFMLFSVVIVCLGWTFFAVADVQLDDRSKRISDLQAQKIELLQDIFDRYQFGYSKGKAVLDNMLLAEHELLHAKLEVAESQDDFIAIRESLLKNRIRLVEARVADYRMGNVAEVVVMAARVQKLDAELDLERERARDLSGRE